MTRAVDALRSEEERRDQEVNQVRHAISSVYAVGGIATLVTLAGDVYRTVQESLELRVMRPPMRSLIREVIIGMGAEPLQIGGRPCFAAVRRHDTPVARAREESAALKRRLHRGPSAVGASGGLGAVGETATWEQRLKAEGMPAELPALKRGGSLEKLGAGFAVKQEGVHRVTGPSVQADIYSGDNEKVTDLLAEAELEVKVLRLRAEGLSLRKIGIAVGEDKMRVSRILKRVARRLGQDVQDLDE